jgi:hypothetical protein
MTDPDSRAHLLLKPFKNLSNDEILQMRAYKSMLNRIKNISNMPIGENGKSEFINRNTERMRKNRQLIKEQKNQILISDDKSQLNQKELQIALVDRNKQIIQLEIKLKDSINYIPKIIISKPITDKIINKTYTIKNINQYIQNIQRIHSKFTKSDVNVEFLKNIFEKKYTSIETEYVINNLKYILKDKIPEFIKFLEVNYTNINTRRSYISSFVVLCSIISSLHPSYEILTAYMQSLIKNYENKRDDNDITIENSNKLINFDPVEIDQNLDQIKDIKAKLIFSIYTLITPRRLEWANVQILEEDNNIDNIIILNKNKSKTVIIFNKYKTSSKYGKQILDNLPSKFIDILYDYIEKFKKSNNDYLFTKSPTNFKSIPESAFGILISSIFKSVYHYDITNTYIRIAYATYYGCKSLSNNDIEKIASDMGHSVKVHSQYVKKFIK